MTDRLSPENRSKNMSAIHGKNTSIEQFICHELFIRGYRYRKNVNYIYGHPDLFLRKCNTAIFVHGCFWHRHVGCKYAYMPKTNIQFWEEKFSHNILRDKIVTNTLNNQGIKCIVVWECTVHKMMKDVEYNNEILQIIERFFHDDRSIIEL